MPLYRSKPSKEYLRDCELETVCIPFGMPAASVPIGRAVYCLGDVFHGTTQSSRHRLYRAQQRGQALWLLIDYFVKWVRLTYILLFVFTKKEDISTLPTLVLPRSGRKG